jgi:hypothetical protein
MCRSLSPRMASRSGPPGIAGLIVKTPRFLRLVVSRTFAILGFLILAPLAVLLALVRARK